MGIHFYARFEKKNDSLLLTRTFDVEETEDVTEDIARLNDIYAVKDWRNLIVSIKAGKALFSLLNGENKIFKRALQEADYQREPLQLFIQGEECIPNVPFESVFDSQFLACSKVCIIHHVSNRGCNRKVITEDRPLRILFMACRAERVEPVLDYEKEEEVILKVTENLPVEVDVEDTGSLQGLAESLKLRKYDAVHLSGHADIRERNPVFLMEDEEGSPVYVTPDQLQEVLKLNPPRLVFLSGCRTGEAPHHEAALSFSSRLVREHSSAVLGWGLPVSDPGATRAAEILYSELGKGESLLKAVLSTRQELVKGFLDWPLLRLFSNGTPLDRALVTRGQTVPVKPWDIQYAYLKHKQVKVLKKGFVGRRRQIQRGIRTLKNDEEKVGLLLHGAGGLGKSCLAGKFCDRFKDRTLIVVHGRLEEPILFEAVRDALIQNGDERGQIILQEQKEMTEKIRMLCLTSFKQGKYLIVLDDFEKNLTGYEKGTPTLTEEVTPLLRVLLQYLPRTEKRTHLIITSRYTFPLSDEGKDIVNDRLECIGLTSFRGADERKKIYELENIRKYPDTKTKQDLIKAGRGNPRLMEDLDTLVKLEIDATELLQAVQGKQEEFIQQLIFREILSSQSREFLQVLKSVSIYRLPVTKEGLALVCTGIPTWESQVETGVQLGLLEKDKRKVSYYWVTPLLREELFKELDETEKEMYDRAACTYYQKVLSTSFVPEYAYELIDHGLQCGMTGPVITEGARLLQYLRMNLLYGSALREGIQILRSVSDLKEDESLSRFFFEFGGVLYDVGEARKAIDYYGKALKIDREIYGENHPDVATNYSNLGLAWNALGDFRKAIDYYERALKIDREIYGENHPAAATRYNNLGGAWNALGDSRKAIDYFEKALKTDVRIYGENHPVVATDYNNLGGAWNALGDSRKAVDYFEKALKIDVEIYGENHPAVAIAHNNLGLAWNALGNSKKAIDYYEKALRIDREIYGESHPDVATNYNNLGRAWKTMGNSKRAVDYFEKALKIEIEIYGENHPAVAAMYNNLGSAWYALGDSRKAVDYFEKALKIGIEIYGENHPAVATGYNNLGLAWNALGDSRKAVDYYGKALKIDVEIYGENHPDVAAMYNNLGSAWYALGDSRRAIDYFEKALKIGIEIYGENHPAVAADYNNLGLAWNALGDSRRAIDYFEKALKIGIETYGETHPDVAARYNNLGSAWYAVGDSRKAIDYFEKALKIGIETYGETHPDMAAAYNNLGLAWHALGDSRKAVEYYEKALRIVRGTCGGNHPYVAKTHNNLGLAWHALGDSRKAVEYYEKALRIVREAYGENHPAVATSYYNLGLAWNALGDSRKAFDYLQVSYRIFLNLYGDNHPHTRSVKEALDCVCKK